MKLGEVVEFRKDLYFEGAVQADWFYNTEKANIVAENFVFHGKEYYGVENNNNLRQKRIDTISLVKNLAQKINDEQSNPLTLAIADYGTGKSHFAVTLATLFSGAEYAPKTYRKVIENITNIDSESGVQISQLCNEKNFVLVINGMHDFNLNSEILKAAQKSLQVYGLDDSKLRKLNRALNTAELFFTRSSSSLLTVFEKYAKKYDWTETGEDLVNRIKNNLLTEEIAFNIVNDAYSEVNGQEIQWDEGISASNILELLVTEYCGINGKFNKVILLFDEFGRYLEYASNNNSAKSGESALQQIFETAQNSEGLLHIINFIQSDIKTYLQRVDPTSNITRYIGRYDASDKFYISSNLETVFANLIQRKNKDSFYENVSTWLDDNEQRWKALFDNLNRWLNTKGMWKNYEQFRKVAVEGIFPMHPISTFMLTQLSDYLQNRSSLTLTSYYISKYADAELDKFNMPIVYPEELMSGDLYKEMYAAESDGRQSTQQCLKYSSVLKKMDGKLDEYAMTVLRGNLVLRILKFKTRSYDDVLLALSICTNLQIDVIKNQLKWLVDEYAVLEFDEQSNCFDFMEDSNGAHDYKIYKNRILKQTNIDKSYIVTNQKILEIANLLELQTTDFGIRNKISTNEWNYKQEIMLAENFTQTKAMGIYSEWKTAITSTEPKGKLVWLYINKDSDTTAIENVAAAVKELKNSPTIVMLLKDSDNKLFNLLKEYKALAGFDYNSKVKFDKFYKEDLLLSEDKIREQFEILKKERNVFDTQGNITQLDSRLSVSLRNKFEQIYTNVVPFWFDGFISKSNNIAPTSSKYFCQIITNLISGNFNKTTYNNLEVMIRTRIDTLLLTTSRDTSWKCVNSEYQIVPPENKNVRKIYNEIKNIIEEQGTYSCKALFDIYTMPPYGLSIDVIVLLVAVICANNSYCLRFKLDGQSMTIDYWKNKLIDQNKYKINHDILKRSYFEFFDSEEVNKKYIRIFDKIENTRDLELFRELNEELDRLKIAEKIPDELNGRLRIAENLIIDAQKAINQWDDYIGAIQVRILEAEERKKTSKALFALNDITKSQSKINEIFGEKFDFSESYVEELKRSSEMGIKHIKENFNAWLENLYCFSLADMTQFESKCRNYTDILKNIGLPQYAAKVEQHCSNILANKKEIKSRQELKDDCLSFLKKTEIGHYVSYTALVEWSKNGKELQDRIKKYTSALGEDTVKITDELDSRMRLIERNKETITREIGNIWDDLDHIQTQNDIRTLDHNIFTVLQKDLPKSDEEDLIELQNNLNAIQFDMNSMHVDNLSRQQFNLIKKTLLEKYKDIDYDFDALQVIENAINGVEDQMNRNEEIWKKNYLVIPEKTHAKLLWWKEKVQIVPEYLSDDSIKELDKMKEDVEIQLSQFRIEEILHCFNKLTDVEKKECVEKLKTLI